MYNNKRSGKVQWQPVRRDTPPREPASRRTLQELPIFAHKQQILQHIHANTLTFVQGESGCGKSIGLPQIILDDALSRGKRVCILVAEPHSDQARSLAGHVASQRGSIVGGEIRYVVNPSPFQCGCRHAGLTYVTSSQLFEWLLYSKEVWQKMTHLILDEVDNRSIDQDLLFLLVKLVFMDIQASSARNKRIVVISGRMDQCPLRKYYSFLVNSEAYSPVFVSEVKAIQPRKVVYLEDFTKELLAFPATAKDMVNTIQNIPASGRNIPHLLFDLVGEIVANQACAGDVFLIFLPGMGEIRRLESTLIEKLSHITNHVTFKVSLLLPYLSQNDQKMVLQCTPNQANVIISTNFAVRSMMMPSVKYVIDFGMEKVLSFNRRRGMNVLANTWTSKTSVRQRAAKGSCNTVFRLFTRKTYESLKEDANTEMNRSCLSQPLLKVRAHMYTLGSMDVLFQQLLDPPDISSLTQTVEFLRDAGAIHGQSVSDFSLTQLGKLAVALSLNVSAAHLILLGLLLCCSVESIIIAAGLMLPFDLLKKPYFESGCREVFRFRDDEQCFFKGKNIHDSGMYSDMIIFCNVYRQWLNKASWEKQWISENCVNKIGLHLLVEKVHLLAANLADFMEKENLVETMGSEYKKIMELRKGHMNQSGQCSWLFCDNIAAVLLTITGAFITNVIIGNVPNAILAQEEAREITMAGLNPDNTFKLSNIPPNTLDDPENFEEAIKVLGPISKILVFKDSSSALVECRRSAEEEQHSTLNSLPEAARRAYFLASQKKRDGLKLTLKEGSDMQSVCIGSTSTERQIFWSTYVKGRKHGVNFDKHTNLPQCAFELHSQEQFLVAVAANFIGAENSKVHVSTTTLLPAENYFSITALLLFRPFKAYLILTDSAQKRVYSLQYGPLMFHFSPQYMLVEHLDLIEGIRKKLKTRVLESQLCQGYIVEEISHLLNMVASQKQCEPHLNPIIGPWREYPSFKLIDIEKCSLAWKLNMTSTYKSRARSAHTCNLDEPHFAQDTEESSLLKAFKKVEPDLSQQYLEEWLDGNKELNQVFFSLLERLIADSELKEQACVVLRYMHKRCSKIVPKKKKIYLESWYHSLCNPVLVDEIPYNAANIPQPQKILLQRQHSMEDRARTSLHLQENYLPIVSKTMSLTAVQINKLRSRINTNANQAKILLPKTQSQTENIVVFGHPVEVEATMKWVELITTKSSTRKLWEKSINHTYFVPERQFDHICCTQLGPGDKLYGDTSFKGYVQFFVQDCIDAPSLNLHEVKLNLNQISQVIKGGIATVDKSSKIEIQARLGRVVFACSENRKIMLPFQRSEPLEKLLNALRNRTVFKQYFSDTLTKEEYFHIKACLRLFKSVSVHRDKKITIFLKDPADFEGSAHVTKITIKDSTDKPGNFELVKVQQKERLAVIDLVHLRTGHVKADIRLSVQGLKDEHIEECYQEFVSNIRLDGVILKFPKGPFDIQQQRIKNTEEYAYGDFSVSLNEITQVQGKTCLPKYEVEISPIHLGISQLSVQDAVEHLDTFLSKILVQAQTISTQLCLNLPSSSSITLAQAMICLWRSGKRQNSDLKYLFYHQFNQGSQIFEAFNDNQKKELRALLQFDIATLVEILWQIDGSDFNGINLSETLLSFLFRSLQFMKVFACESLDKRAQEIISRQGFPPRVALAYASLFKCHCLRYYAWTKVLAPHLLELVIEETQDMKEICHKTLNLLVPHKSIKENPQNLSLERILYALGRHWADRSPKCFLQMYNLALKKEQECPAVRTLIQEFVRHLFIRYPSEAALFVLGSASCYINDLEKDKASDTGISASLIRLLNLLKDSKVIVTEDCRSLALNVLLSLEEMSYKVQEIEKKVFAVYEIDVAMFRHCHYQKILSKSLALKAFHLKELKRRGLTYELCQKVGLKSWTPGRNVSSSCLIPGLNKEGNTLIGSPGIFIPARDPSGQITGAQIKVDQPTTGKYKWLSSNKVFEDGRGPSIDDEWPLFYCASSISGVSTLGMCEGGLKAHVLSFLGAIPVIGASGAAFPRSRNLLERYLAVLDPEQIIFFPDAGSQCNDQVSRWYFQTFRLIREFGYSLLVAWWGQVNKTDHEDIDDLLCNGLGEHSIPLLSPSNFWHILHPAVRKKLANEFPDYSGSCGFSEPKNKEAFTDTDEIEVSRALSIYQAHSYDEYHISIPKKIITSMPPPPNDLVTPGSTTEFIIEIRTVKLSDNDAVDNCLEWMMQDTVKLTACLGVLCQYDSQCYPCLLGLSFHQRCLLIQIPSSMDPQIINTKLQSLLLDTDIVKAGVNIDKDALHMYHCLHLTTNNCIKLFQQFPVKRQKAGLLDMFRALFKWEWHEKTEVIHSNWKLNPMTLEQIKSAALSAWSCHLIWAQKRERPDGQAKSFCLDEVRHELLDYFQRSSTNIDTSDCQSHTSFELTGATLEIQQGFLILDPTNVRSKALNQQSVVELSFKDGRKPEEYTTKRVGNKNVLLHRTTTGSLREPEVDVSTISKLVVDNSKYLDMQKQKLEDAIHSILCDPDACPSHILMALRCTTGRRMNKVGSFLPPQDLMMNRIRLDVPFSPPQGLMLNSIQLDASRMMLSNPLCAVVGPPGTGKTRVITGVAKTWEQSTTQGHILLCSAQQNVAVRHMAETMVKNKVKGVMLLISQDYYTDWRQDEYKHIEDHIVVAGHSMSAKLKVWSDRNKRPTPRILLCTLALIGGSSFYTCVKHCNILYMIIDESSQAAEGTLISSLICLPHLERLSVLGDPCQLPPFGKSVQSIFDLVARNCEVLTLQLQYRMPKSIADFVSREFYRGRISTASKGSADDHCSSLLWVDVCGSAKTGVRSTSLCNDAEADAIVQLCKKYKMQEAGGVVLTSSSSSSSSSMLLSSTLSSGSSLSSVVSTSSSFSSTSLSLSSSSLSSSFSASSSSSSPSPSVAAVAHCSKATKLVVLTLYEAQRLLISNLLAKNEIQEIPVHNVDAFQGQEAEIIVISLVVGTRMSPFASDRRRACVLLSRAKRMLYVFGDLKAMKKCTNNACIQDPIIWKSLALECEKHDWLMKADTISEMNFSAMLT